MSIRSFIQLFCILIPLGFAEARVIELRVFAMPDNSSMPERYVKTADGYELLKFIPMQAGPLIKAQAVEFLPLFEMKVNEQKQVVYQLAESVKLPVPGQNILLLGWNGQTSPEYRAINDPFSAAKYNHWLMVNTTPKDISFQVGWEVKPFLIPANNTHTFEIDSPENVGVAVEAKALFGKKVKSFYSTYWPVIKGERSIVLFVQEGERIRVCQICDVLLSPGTADSIKKSNP